jgi:two-component system, OmpR family, alkaline phosphatase synthesis response regulator PhoP
MMNENKYTILVVDDEEDIRQIVGYNLLRNGYEVEEAQSGESVLEMDLSNIDLILLDIMMEGISGIDLAKKLKQNPKTKNIPIIFLTAKNTESDIVGGLSIGGDDYIAKPFSIKEVLARVEAVLRRYANNRHEEENILQYKDLVLNKNNKSVQISGKEIPFTKTEFDILYLLLSHKETLFSREDILKRIWPQDTVVVDRTVDVRIATIRKKLGIYAQNISTKSGIGYLFKVTE